MRTIRAVRTSQRASPSTPVAHRPGHGLGRACAWPHPVPAIVGEVLQGGGQPLDGEVRTVMEPHFGHNLARVRVHDSPRAAESARAVNARAFAIGDDIVMGAGQYAPGTPAGQRLLAHELSHVVAQNGAAGNGETLQRSGLEDTYTTEGQLVHGPTGGDPGQALGREEPDCTKSVLDFFVLGWMGCSERPECCVAQVIDRKDTSRSGIFRADYSIEGKPDCAFDQKSHGFWLGDQWRIVEITLSRMTVMNMCGDEETLLASGTLPEAPPGANPAERSIIVGDSNFGAGKVTVSEDCRDVTFQPDDRSAPTLKWTMVTKGKNDNFYVREDDKKNLHAPPDVENSLRVYLFGERCGQSKPKEVKEEAPEEMIPGVE